MPIERKDRSFDLIFDQVSMDHVPAQYIKEVRVDLGTGERIILTKADLLLIKNKSADEIIKALTVDSMSNISLKLDYTAIKKDVIRGVTGFLGKHFDK
jgi:GTP:adenosylcobinamide-phosphate guanylyltransferase|tara:strand:- start:338 stop:631 length:294 start_codon:yes stop_codon:yes gene_type:complete